MSDQENTAPTAPETTPKEIASKHDPIVFLEEEEDLDSQYEKSLQGFQEEEIVTESSSPKNTAVYIKADLQHCR